MVHGTGQLLRAHCQRLALPVFVLQAGQILLAGGIRAEQEHRRFGNGLRERGSADLGAGGAIKLPRRCFGTRDQTAGGDEILASGEALDGMDS